MKLDSEGLVEENTHSTISECMSDVMDGLMDGWVGGCTNGWMDRQTDEFMEFHCFVSTVLRGTSNDLVVKDKTLSCQKTLN